MTASPPARFRLGSDVDVSPVVERLLLGVVQDVVIRGADRVTAARVPRGAGVDVFAPEVVVWAYQGGAEWALRALLDLVHPHHPDAPTVVHPAPRSLHVPRREQRPLTIRLPSPGRASMRATRLTTIMTTAVVAGQRPRIEPTERVKRG